MGEIKDTSLPHTRGRDIVVAGKTEESPRTREGRLAAATLEQEMGRRSVAEAIRPIRERAVASSSSAERTITREMVAEACDTLIQERHPASPPRVAREQQEPNREPASRDGRDRSPGRTSSPAAEVGVDAQTPEGQIPERNGAGAGVSPVQP